MLRGKSRAVVVIRDSGRGADTGYGKGFWGLGFGDLNSLNSLHRALWDIVL